MIEGKDEQIKKMHEDFVKFCDEFLEKAKCYKMVLAKKLGIDSTSFSHYYTGDRPVSKDLLDAVQQLAANQPIVSSPVSIAKQQELPIDISRIREEIASLKAVQDMDRKDKNEMRERIAVLEADLQRANADSEKKIRGFVAEAIRVEAGRIAEQLEDRLSGGRGEAAHG